LVKTVRTDKYGEDCGSSVLDDDWRSAKFGDLTRTAMTELLLGLVPLTRSSESWGALIRPLCDGKAG
jgi:hypothetical protein